MVSFIYSMNSKINTFRVYSECITERTSSTANFMMIVTYYYVMIISYGSNSHHHVEPLFFWLFNW